MKVVKYISLLLLSFVFMHCGSVKKVENPQTIAIGQVYYEISTDNDYLNVYVPITSNPNQIVFDSIYFKGQKAKLEFMTEHLYQAQMTSVTIYKPDLIMSNTAYGEYGNAIPKRPVEDSLNLKADECILIYKLGNEPQYLKVGCVLKR